MLDGVVFLLFFCKTLAPVLTRIICQFPLALEQDLRWRLLFSTFLLVLKSYLEGKKDKTYFKKVILYITYNLKDYRKLSLGVFSEFCKYFFVFYLEFFWDVV